MGAGQHLGVDAPQVVVERQAQIRGRGPRAGHGNAEHGVGSQTGLVVSAVQVDKTVVDLHLAQHVQADDRVGYFAVDMLHGLGHALAAVTFFVAVTHFQSFAAAGGCPGRHGGAGALPGLQAHLHFHGGIAAGIQYFSAE